MTRFECPTSTSSYISSSRFKTALELLERVEAIYLEGNPDKDSVKGVSLSYHPLVKQVLPSSTPLLWTEFTILCTPSVSFNTGPLKRLSSFAFILSMKRVSFSSRESLAESPARSPSLGVTVSVRHTWGLNV
ncbi:hypothetical protein FOZ60_007178 [Perkinsus olseni]|uniref:Uncharacterized protein n=1 Tax=Perkinsus olseni TaxID=32597 RepID=A0A7J6NMT6_PEROL|nr:hypothetical protein FOZ60_007178 [Perkinsus olseni]